MKPTPSFTFRLPKGLRRDLTRLAEHEHRSLSGYIIAALFQHVTERTGAAK